MLLVSPDFLASDFITEHELPYLLRAREDGNARIVIAVISECFWDETSLEKIQTAHDPANALDGLSDSGCNKVIKSICRKLPN